MLVTTVQPDYLIGDRPDRQNREYIIDQMKNAPKDGLMLFPEYSNAGGISTVEEERQAIPYAKNILSAAADSAKQNSAMIAVNVLEERDGKIKNSTYLFGKKGETVFVYDKQHLPPSETELGVIRGTDSYPCNCVCDYEGIRFAFLTCYDVYFNEQIEYIAKHKPDIILLPGLQRGERVDILEAQTKMIAFRCNAYVVKSSFSMRSHERGGCSMIVSPDGKILENMGEAVGSVTADIDLSFKYMRSAGYGGKTVRNDDFINAGLCPEVFKESTVNILITGVEGPKFHLYREALKREGVNIVDGYLPEYSDKYDGLLIAGGCDVEPELYGESDNGAKNCDKLRDSCEYGLIEEFAKQGKPIFGICRGMQILNVYFGGTLNGDLPETPKHHSDGEPIYHTLKAESDSIVGRLFGEKLTANSFHHQSVKVVADGFKVTARSVEDGVIEAMEHKEKPWFAVQFHPERMLDGCTPTDDAKPLFDYFIKQCKASKQ